MCLALAFRRLGQMWIRDSTVVARAPKYRGCGSGCESDGSGPMFHDFMCLPCCLLCWRGFARRLGCDVTCLRVCKAYVCVPMALLIILLPQFTRHIEALRKHFYHDAVVVFVCGGGVGRKCNIAIYTQPSCTGAEFNSSNIIIPIIFHSENSVLNGL